MAINFRLNIGGTQYDLPRNWRNLAYQYNFNGSDTFLTDVRGVMQFCGREPYTSLRTLYLESICGVTIVQWDFLCSPIFSDFTELFTGNVRRSDFAFICGKNPCEVEISPEQFNAYVVLENNLQEEVAVACGNSAVNGDAPTSLIIPVHQIQSGAYYREGETGAELEFCFLKIEHLIEEMVARLGWTSGSLVSSILTRPFLTDNREIIVANAADAGSTITIFLEYETGFSKTITINVDATDTQADIQQLIKKGILAIQSLPLSGTAGQFSPQWNEFQFQPAEVQFTGAGNPELRSDHPIKTLTVTGGNSGAYTVNQTQTYQYGLRDLIFSTNGLNTPAITISWGVLKTILSAIHPVVYSNNSTNGLQIQSYADNFNNRTPGQISNNIFPTPQNTVISPKDGGAVRMTTRPEILKSRAIFGQRFELEDLQDCLNGFGFVGDPLAVNTGVSQNNFGTPAGGGIRPTPWPNIVTIPVGAGGVYTFKGNVEFLASGGPNTVSFDLVDTDGATPETLIASSNQVPINDLDVKPISDFFQSKTFCLEGGQTYYFRWASVNGNQVTISAGPNTTLEIQRTTADADFPYIREDSSHAPDPYARLQLFGTCDGIFDKEIPDSVAAGIGFAIDQQVSGCSDYGDIIFLSFYDPINDRTQRFPRSMYFGQLDANVPSCYQGQEVIYYYHNAPLMWPQIAYEFREYLPSQINTTLFAYTVTMTSGGSGNEPTITNFTRNLTLQGNGISPTHNRTQLYEFKGCQSILQALARTLDRVLSFENCHGENLTTTAVIREMATKFDGQGLISFVVEGDAPPI